MIKEIMKVVYIVKKQIIKMRMQFILVAVLLILETMALLVIPQVISKIIDGLAMKSDIWLYTCIIAYCLIIIIAGLVKILNKYVSEKLGWSLCDSLRTDMFKKILSFKIKKHKHTHNAMFLEKLEGDVNQLGGFFSTMLVDMTESLLLVIGVLFVFFMKFYIIGIIFAIISILILFLFIRTQGNIASLWKTEREDETRVLSEFTESMLAWKDIIGIGKETYFYSELDNRLKCLEKSYVKASFWGNFPSTIFYSLLNIGEGIVLLMGIILMERNVFSIGDIYLVLSYVGFLNSPFMKLKYEFSQLPQILAAIKRVNEIYENPNENVKDNTLIWSGDGSIEFKNVIFGYDANTKVINDISFCINSGERVMIQGRTGSGKSTILHLLAGFYEPLAGSILIGGQNVNAYKIDSLNKQMYYILQTNPVLEDSIKNNVTRYNDSFTDDDIQKALVEVGLESWLKNKKNNLDEIIKRYTVSQDEAQLLAWAGAILWRPKILLVDEFDAFIHDDTINIIDKVIERNFSKTTIVMISHKEKTKIHMNKIITIDAGEIISMRINKDEKKSKNN